MNININANVIPIGQEGLVKKLIAAEYPDKCNLCFGQINKGEKVAWYGKGYGVRHFNCYLKRETLLSNEEFDQLSEW